MTVTERTINCGWFCAPVYRYHVKALYDYSGEQASNLAMMTGDVFAVIADFDPEW